MDMAEYLKTVDEQIKVEAAKEARRHATKGERRQQQGPVQVERRTGPDRRSGKRGPSPAPD